MLQTPSWPDVSTPVAPLQGIAVVLAMLRSAAIFGVEACPVQVEVDAAVGMPGLTLVGLPDTSVRESRDRVRTAIRNSGFPFPRHRLTVNLAPADVRKIGAAFDLPIALGILAADGQVQRRQIDDWLVLGELSLDGSIQSTRGVLPIAVAARREGLRGVVVPRGNAAEAEIVSGLRVLSVATLADAVAALNDPDRHDPEPRVAPRMQAIGEMADFRDVRSQALPRRALEVAAAGGHSLLLMGAPGGGKTMMARRLPGILPPLSLDESLESTAIHSVAGLLGSGGLLAARPFRAPHPTVSGAALVGGGAGPRPGEVSLAHNGVLFLDEILEFQRPVLESLRQPLEEGCIHIARAARTARFPARFLLVAAMNPCPCGFLGDARRECRCTPRQVERYRRRLSGPLLDRLDLAVEVPRVPVEALRGDAGGEASAAIRERVLAARLIQQRRLGPTGGRANATLSARAVAEHCRLSPAAERVLERAAARFALSARAYHRVLKVARTLADLAAAPRLTPEHVAEAVQFRLGR